MVESASDDHQISKFTPRFPLSTTLFQTFTMSTECPVCYETLNEAEASYCPNGHGVCEPCFQEIRRHRLSGPQCRAPLSTFRRADQTYAIQEGRCANCGWLLDEQPIHLPTCKYRLDTLMAKPERLMLWIVEKIATMWKIRNLFNGSGIMEDNYDNGPGYLLWTAREYELLDRLCEYAVNERDLWNQRFPDEVIRDSVLDIVFDVV